VSRRALLSYPRKDRLASAQRVYHQHIWVRHAASLYLPSPTRHAQRPSPRARRKQSLALPTHLSIPLQNPLPVPLHSGKSHPIIPTGNVSAGSLSLAWSSLKSDKLPLPSQPSPSLDPRPNPRSFDPVRGACVLIYPVFISPGIICLICTDLSNITMLRSAPYGKNSISMRRGGCVVDVWSSCIDHRLSLSLRPSEHPSPPPFPFIRSSALTPYLAPVYAPSHCALRKCECTSLTCACPPRLIAWQRAGDITRDPSCPPGSQLSEGEGSRAVLLIPPTPPAWAPVPREDHVSARELPRLGKR
jgi:hypothetical protein